MAKEIYSPMEKILIDGALMLHGDDGEELVSSSRQEHNNKLYLLLDYEMNQLISGLEKQLEEQGRGEDVL